MRLVYFTIFPPFFSRGLHNFWYMDVGWDGCVDGVQKVDSYQMSEGEDTLLSLTSYFHRL